jgi:hypothetical protein
MQRFFCTTCDKVKRVQSAPVGTHFVKLADIPVHARLGECRGHREMSGATRAQVNHRGKVRKPFTGKGKGLSATQARSKSKKG